MVSLRRFLELSTRRSWQAPAVRGLWPTTRTGSADNLRYSRVLYTPLCPTSGDAILSGLCVRLAGRTRRSRRSRRSVDPMASANRCQETGPRLPPRRRHWAIDYWDRSNFWSSARYLLASWTSRRLVRLYDRSQAAHAVARTGRGHCRHSRPILALRQAGRASEADSLLAIYARRTRRSCREPASAGPFSEAQCGAFAALSGRDNEALDLTRQLPGAIR